MAHEKRVLYSTCLYKATEVAAYISSRRYRMALRAAEDLRELVRAMQPAPGFVRTANPTEAARVLVEQAEAGTVFGMELASLQAVTLLERIVSDGEEMAREAQEERREAANA